MNVTDLEKSSGAHVSQKAKDLAWVVEELCVAHSMSYGITTGKEPGLAFP